MQNKLTARVHQVLPLSQGVSGSSGKQWKKQVVVVAWEEGNPTRTNYLALTNFSDADEFAKLKPGDEVEVWYSVSSRQWNENWYHDVICKDWKVLNPTVNTEIEPDTIEDCSVAQAPVTPSKTYMPSPSNAYVPYEYNSETLSPQEDDLPF